MVKSHLLNKKIPIICIPKSHLRSYVKKIFKNLIIIDNIFFNIILLPFIYTDFISSKPDNIESFFKNKKLERTSKNFYTDIVTSFEKNNMKDPFVFSEKYIKMMIDYKNKYFNNFNLKDTFVLHVRDENYIKTSYLRSGTIENYFPAIDMLLESNYQIIRIIHSKSNKLEFSKNYKEINIDNSQNQLFQFYLLSNCKGFLCCHSGPGPLGVLLKTPILELNLFPLDFTYAVKKGDIFIPKKIKNIKNNYVKYKKIFSSNLKYMSSIKQMHKCELEAEENSSDEIMEGVKEFICNLKDTSVVTDSENYIHFKNNFLKDSEIRFANGQISKYFLKKNHNLFL
jgi:putative glycosyltransferase (TIGR04372 family)